MDENEELVILVDARDREIGQQWKFVAHQRGDRHRAISVCVTDARGRMLLQRRAASKYHSGGLWTNACCTHPRPGELVAVAAERRLREELGIACPLQFLFNTHYEAPVGANLIENEIVHVFHGEYSGLVVPNPIEVDDVAWVSRKELLSDIDNRPECYTYWFNHYVRVFGEAIFDGRKCAQTNLVSSIYHK
jgi:isopentenyl-diphosphate Delta-isomerase